MVKLYTKPACPDCRKTKASFKKNGIQYEEIDLSTSQEALETIKQQGFLSAPVVITDNDSWAGFLPDRISALANEVGEDIWAI